MDGDVRGVGDEAAVGIEQGAGEVEAFLDVRGEGGAAQGDAHLLGDGGKTTVEEFEFDGVIHFVGQTEPKCRDDRASDSLHPSWWRRNHQAIRQPGRVRFSRRSPCGVNLARQPVSTDDRGHGVEHDGRTIEMRAGFEVVAARSIHRIRANPYRPIVDPAWNAHGWV